MKRRLGPVAVGTLVYTLTLAPPGEPTRAEARTKPTRNVSPEDLWLKTASPSAGSEAHEGCVQFADPEAMIGKGAISKITRVPRRLHPRHPSLVRKRRRRESHGFTEGIAATDWQVPDGERITRVEERSSNAT
jgi:hypothetical protein